MPRHYQKKLGGRNYKNYNDETLESALAAIKRGMSQAEASKRWNIPDETLQNKLNGTHNKPPGHPTVFEPTEEQLLTKTLATVSDWGHSRCLTQTTVQRTRTLKCNLLPKSHFI